MEPLKITDYEVLSIISSNYLCTSFKVKHKTTGRYYIWKSIDLNIFSTEDKDIFLSDIKHLCKCCYSIITCIDYILHKEANILYLIIEHNDNTSIQDLILRCKDEQRCIEEQFIWNCFYQVARVLQKVSLTLHKSSSICLNVTPQSTTLDENINIIINDIDLINEDTLSYGFSLGSLLYGMCTLESYSKSSKLTYISKNYSTDLVRFIEFLFNSNDIQIESILKHPSVVSHVSYLIYSQKSYLANGKCCSLSILKQNCLSKISASRKNKNDDKIKEHGIKLKNIQQREQECQSKELMLEEREKQLYEREKKLESLERLTNEKLQKVEKYMEKCKTDIYQHNSRTLLRKRDSFDDADIPLINKTEKLKQFTRSASERRVRLSKKIDSNIYESQESKSSSSDKDSVKHNKCTKNMNTNQNKNLGKYSADDLQMAVSNYRNKILCNANKASSDITDSKNKHTLQNVQNGQIERPASWTEESKKQAFDLLKIMHNKENINATFKIPLKVKLKDIKSKGNCLKKTTYF